MTAGVRSMDVSRLRGVWSAALGRDPGPLVDTDALLDRGLSGIERLLVVNAVEAELGISFPDDLLDALETVGDLRHYATTIASHSGPGR